MVFSLCYVALLWILQLAVLKVRSNAFKDLEIVVLRRELAILRRRIRRPAMASADRLCLTSASRAVSIDILHFRARVAVITANVLGNYSVRRSTVDCTPQKPFSPMTRNR